MPGSFGHLVARFFDYLRSQPLSDHERARVAEWLEPAELALFFSQAHPDQAHGYHAASVVVGSTLSEPTLIRAALLHDIGKRHAGLGVVGRSVASILIRLHLPLTARMASYRDHGPIGADELSRAGSPALVVDFARHHHARRPDTIDAGAWDVLQAADLPAKPGLGR